MSLSWLVVVFVVILLSMIVHEIMHGLVSYWLGDDTAKLSGRLTLNPLKHIDPVMTIIIPLLLFSMGGPIFGGAKPVPLNTRKIKGGDYGITLVALAGPFSNLVLAFISFGLFATFGQGNILFGQICNIVVNVNLGFMIFNLIPIPPLDGSRVIYAIAPEFVKDFMKKIEPYGFFVVMILVIVFSTALTSVILGIESLIIDIFMGIFRV